MLNNTIGSIQAMSGFTALDEQPPVPQITEYEFRLYRDLIHGYCGIFFDDAKKETLASRLSFRMKLLGIASFMEYYNLLRMSPNAAEEMGDLIPHLTNNETYFFREMSQIEFLVSLARERASSGAPGGRPFRILSCGCSSGEEAFTIAMLLEEAGLFGRGRGIEITGIDIDRKALEKALRGEYTSYSLRAAEKPFITKYFKKEKDTDRYRLDDRIRAKVNFTRGNLMERGTYSKFRGQDVVLCRNVFIYFSDLAIRGITEHFHETLSEGGVLFLGHSESLSRITDIFQPERKPGIIYYAKKEL